MKKRIAFIVATQYDNVGDLLINKCLINELSAHGEVYLDFKNVPESFKKLLLYDTEGVYDIRTISPFSFKGLGVIPLFFKNPHITHIFKSPGPFGSGGNFMSFFKNMIIGLIYAVFRLKGVKSYLVGNDIHYKDTFDKIALKYFSKKADKLLCRSLINVEEIKRLGIKNVGYIPDMCFGHTPKIDYKKRDNIGVSFRQLDDPLYHNVIVNTIRDLLDSEPNITLTFFYQVERDYNYNKQLYNLFRDEKNVIFRERCLEWTELDLYNSFLFTLSNRLHVLLLGLVYEVIPLALLNSSGKTQKIEDIFESVKLEHLVFKSQIDGKLLRTFFSDYLEFQENIRNIKYSQKGNITAEITAVFNT